MSKENPHRVDALMKKHEGLAELNRDELINWHDVAMQFAPRVMANDLVLIGWLMMAVRTGMTSVNDIRNLCMTERIHRELSA